jgi:hypothetical protein
MSTPSSPAQVRIAQLEKELDYLRKVVLSEECAAGAGEAAASPPPPAAAAADDELTDLDLDSAEDEDTGLLPGSAPGLPPSVGAGTPAAGAPLLRAASPRARALCASLLLLVVCVAALAAHGWDVSATLTSVGLPGLPRPRPPPPLPPSSGGAARALAAPLFNASVAGPVHVGGPPGATHCDGAVPVIRLTGEAPSDGAPPWGPPGALAPVPAARSGAAGGGRLEAFTGWLELTLTDEGPPGGGWAPGACYHGEYVSYAPERCPYEGGNGGGDYWDELRAGRGWEARLWTGGNGYDVRAEGPALLWGPTFDNRDGTYTVRFRAEDVGVYTVEVHRNAVRGCAHAECDVPGSLCPKAPYYHRGWQDCWGEAPGPCAVRVANATLTVARRPAAAPPPPARADLPPCPPRDAGVLPGRWVRAEVAARAASAPPYFGPAAPYAEAVPVPFPFVWQFFDCTLAWMDAPCARACVARHQVVSAGFSRERANLYDVAEFMDEGFAHLKAHDALRLGVQHADGRWGLIHNLSFVSTYHPFELDQWSWNQAVVPPGRGLSPWMAVSNASMGSDLAALGLCHNDSASPGGPRPTSLLLAVESLWPAWSLFSGRWRGTAERVLDAVRFWCPGATLVHKTATAARIAAGALTWQRMYGASRAAEAAAAERAVPTLDAFVMTQPWAVNGSVFPDGLHNFVNLEMHDPALTATGNFVSRTIAQLWLRKTCPAACAAAGAQGEDEETDDRRRRRRQGSTERLLRRGGGAWGVGAR